MFYVYEHHFLLRLVRTIKSTIIPARRTPPMIANIPIPDNNIPVERLLSEVTDVSVPLELPEISSLCVSLSDEISEELLLDEGAEELLSDDVVEEISSDEFAEELSSGEVAEELLSDEFSEELSSDEVAEEFSSDDVEEEVLSDELSEEFSSDELVEELSFDELFVSLDVSGSYRSVLVSSVLHTEQVLFSRPSLFSVGAFVVTQLPKEC